MKQDDKCCRALIHGIDSHTVTDSKNPVERKSNCSNFIGFSLDLANIENDTWREIHQISKLSKSKGIL